MNKLTIVILFFVIIVIAGCSCSDCGKNNDIIQVPDNVITAADEYIMTKTGDDIFRKYIKLDPVGCKKVKFGYEMHYKFVMPDLEFVDEEIVFYLNDKGEILSEYGIIGIPQCRRTPEKCTFSIDRNEASEIARINGLPKGVKEWILSFEWSAEYKSYVWKVMTTISESGSKERYKGNGELIYIDPYDGAILSKSVWKVQ